jgi:hypothetical protein
LNNTNLSLIARSNDKITNRILFVLGLLLFGYTASRAYLLCFTYDESWTYLAYVHNGFITFKRYVQGDTNNHLLNTWLMELSIKLFGESEFTMRLPNVLSHLLFLVYSAKIVRTLSSKALIIGGFLLLNMNPYLIEFFSVARGYGISMGLIMASLYFAYKFISLNGDYRNAFISVLFASIAVLAYFLMINFLLIITSILLIQLILRYRNINGNTSSRKTLFLIRNSMFIVSPLMIFFYVIPVIINLKKVGSMDFGTGFSFWHCTVFFLIAEANAKFPKVDYKLFIGEVFVALTLITSAVLIMYNIIKKKERLFDSFLNILFMIIILSFFASYLQKMFFNILYPLGRYALIYYPLFTLLLIFLFNKLQNISRLAFRILFYSVLTIVMVNCLFYINFKSVHEWSTEADTRDMVNYLTQRKKEISPDKNNITIGVTFQSQFDVNFYKTLYHLNWLNENGASKIFDKLNDYYYLSADDTAELKGISYKIIKTYPNTKTMLLENQQK